jgi:hypothetical protein
VATALDTHSALVAALTANTAVAAFIAADGLYFATAPAGAPFPYIVYQQIASSPDQCHIGPSAVTERTYQFACFAATAFDAIALRDAVIGALDGVALATGEVPTLQDERDGNFDENVEVFRADCDLIV